jgi:hypothetical protein
VSGTDPAHWSPVARVVASQIPRSISSSERNHGLRFEGILKFDLQGNRPPRAKNRQIRLLERAQSFSPFNSFFFTGDQAGSKNEALLNGSSALRLQDHPRLAAE